MVIVRLCLMLALTSTLLSAFKENGFPSYVKALTTFCNIRECDGEKDVCFGLPCRNGVCVCPA